MRKSLLKKIAGLSLSALMLFTVGCGSTSDSSSLKSSAVQSTASGDDQSLEKVMNAGKLVLGLDPTFKPMGYTDENDKIVGFDIDCAEEVCKRMGIELETRSVAWDTKEQDLNAGTIDCIWNGLSVSDERKQKMLMSEPYMKNEMVFVVGKDSDAKSQNDLYGKNIGVQNGSTAQEILSKSDAVVNGGASMTELETNVAALQQLDLKMIDAVFMDSVVADYEIAHSDNGYQKLADGLESEEYAIGFRLGDNALCNKVTDTLKEMKKDGKLAEISTKWFGEDKTIIG